MAVKKTATACALDSVGILNASAGLRPLVLISITDKIVNRFEEPSDIAGKIFEDFDDWWKAVLHQCLREGGTGHHSRH